MANADNRLWAAVAAQTAGVLILFLIGIIFDVWNEPCFAAMEAGIHHIFVIAFMVFVGLLVGCVQVFVPTQKCELGDDHVDKVIKTFLVTDIPLLTLLVCLEGGLVSSVFAPLFFLIFVAYNAVEQPGRLRRKLLILSMLGLGIVCCSVVSYLVGLGVLKNLFGLRSLSITLFSDLDSTRYNINFLLVTLLSLAAYIVQLNIIKVPRGKRHFQEDGAPDNFDHEQKENREPRVSTNSKLTYGLALLFACIFIASLAILLGGEGGVLRPNSDPSVLTIIAVIASAIGTVSTIILGWRKDRREARETELKILQLKQGLETASETPALPVPQEKRDTTVGEDEVEREPLVSKMLAERIEAGDFPSAVYVVAERGRARFADALGDAVRDPETRPATLETIYDLASLTKPLVTGLLAALQVERGALKLDAPVSSYLKEFDNEEKRAITIRHLLTHTSGLPAWRPLYLLSTGGPERVLDTIAAQPLEQEPGSRVVYSDLGFITLGLVLQRVANASLAELARREIFSPLKLARTFFNPSKSLQTEVAACESGGNAYERGVCESDGDRAEGAWRTGTIWGEVHDGNAYFLGGAAGHAGLFSTARETLRIAEQFLPRTTRLLKPDTCALFPSNMTEGLNEARSFAWQLAATPESTAGARLPPEAFGHLGFTGTSCWIDPTRERIFILLTNRTHARPLPFVNINSVRRRFHTLAVEALDKDTH